LMEIPIAVLRGHQASLTSVDAIAGLDDSNFLLSGQHKP
jgi:hypothetical protein